MNEIHESLVRCLDTFERLTKGSPFYLNTNEGRARLEAIRDNLVVIANELTLRSVLEYSIKKEEGKLNKQVDNTRGRADKYALPKYSSTNDLDLNIPKRGR